MRKWKHNLNFEYHVSEITEMEHFLTVPQS